MDANLPLSGIESRVFGLACSIIAISIELARPQHHQCYYSIIVIMLSFVCVYVFVLICLCPCSRLLYSWPLDC
jgi:hypothetical protein